MAKKTLETIGTEASRNDSQDTEIAGKQATLVSATNIKTINGASVLGGGDLVVSGAAAWGSITGTLSAQTDLNNALAGKEPAKGADDNFVTDAQLVVIGNTSGANTGDNATNSQYSGLAASKENVGVAAGLVDARLSAANATDLTDGGATTLHSHAGGSQAFPIGSVFLSVVSTNPATLLGYGTWSAIAAGRMLVGLDSGDTDFDTVEETGGAKTKTIAQANLPNISTGAGTSHNHTQDGHNHTQNAHTHDFLPRSATTGSVSSIVTGTLDTSSTISGANQPHNQNATATNQAATATNQAEAAHTHSLGGSGTALNVVNPYFVVYMWKRTA